MTSRAAILARLQRHRGANPAGVQAAAAPSPAGNRAEVTSGQPRKSGSDRAVQIARFTQLASATQMSVAEVPAYSAIPAAVQTYLGEWVTQRRIVVDGMLNIGSADWDRSGLRWSQADTQPDGDVYVREGVAAIVECGAVVIASGAGRALRNDFLAQTHIVIVPGSRLLPAFGDLWALMRAQQGAAGIPREVCLITGPSRTADLGVPAKLGAHGPARVHVLLVGDPG